VRYRSALVIIPYGNKLSKSRLHGYQVDHLSYNFR
jgi:hypothetical protein